MEPFQREKRSVWSVQRTMGPALALVSEQVWLGLGAMESWYVETVTQSVVGSALVCTKINFEIK